MITNPKELGLTYDEWRPSQIEAMEWIQADDWLGENRDKTSIKVLEAPTGSGKTGLILGLAATNSHLRFLILCATKLEQAQYEDNIEDNTIGFISVMGRPNFHCKFKHENATEMCNSADCNLTHVNEAPCIAGKECEFRTDKTCYYFRQVSQSKFANIVVANYAYGLAMMNYAGKALGKFDVIVSDEGHILDQQLEEFLSLKISKRRFEELFPRLWFPAFDSVKEWAAWGKENFDFLKTALEPFEGLSPEIMSSREVRDKDTIEMYLGIFASLGSLNKDWIVEEDANTITFQPVWVTEDSKEVLFNYATRHIIMSGTIPSSVHLGKKVGLSAGEFEFLRLPYLFPVENRRILVRPSVDLTMSSIQDNLPRLVDVIDKLIETSGTFPPLCKPYQKKILIHTVTYRIAEYLFSESDFKEMMLTHRTRDRAAKLEEFKLSQAPKILVSPSMDKAVDLPGDECELIIVCKLPFLYLGSKVMKERVRQDGGYYAHEALMNLIQMVGRGNRQESDVTTSIVLDTLAPRFLRQKVRKMIPQGIKEALVYQ